MMLGSKAHPSGKPMTEFDKIRASVLADRSQFWKNLSLSFYGYNQSGAKNRVPTTHKDQINAEFLVFSKV
jgi:hypothetical protein